MNNQEFYKSARWKKLRESILRRDRYLCQESLRYGKLAEAQTVHHIFPRDKWPEYQWAKWNLISVTNQEHDAFHNRQDGSLTEKGKALLRRICAKEGKEIPEEYR